VSRVSAFVLAGGKSSRMGQDKALLDVNGQTLLARMVAVASAVTSEVAVVGNADKFAQFGRVIEDAYPGHGPLAGIHTALTSSENDLNLILGVDLVFMRPEFLKFMIGIAEESPAHVVVPQIGDRLQPLCAVYKRSFAGIAERALREGRNKITALFEAEFTRIIEENESVAAGFEPEMFHNVNTPEDWEQARRSLILGSQ